MTRRHQALGARAHERNVLVHLAGRWEKFSLPSARLNSSLLAAMPTGMYPGVDSTEVFEFLEHHDA